jgi:protein-S-isoprenylcysteine O-methyltransferase Ste14
MRAKALVIDSSAWISGLSYATGLALIGRARLESEIANGGSALILLPLAYIVFLATVLLIQRHMRLSLLANSFGNPKYLVTSGIFNYSRNPIYVAFFLPLASLAVLSLSAAISAIAIYILAMNLTVIRREERDLLNAFGRDFAVYLTKAPRWLF